jgi:hypothetical protein
MELARSCCREMAASSPRLSRGLVLRLRVLGQPRHGTREEVLGKVGEYP